MPNKSETNSKLTAVLAFPSDMVNYTDCPKTGDTIFHDVTIIGEGAWTDVINKRPIHYTGSELAKMQFKKMTFKAQHDLYGESNITNDIGVIEKPVFQQNPAKWKVDVRIYPTALGKDIATLIKRKQITDISPEFFFNELENNDTPRGIMFMGASSVRQGACRVCTFNEGIGDDVITTKGIENMTEGTPPQTGGTATNGGVTAELTPEQKLRIAALEQEIKDKQNTQSTAFLVGYESLKKENELLKQQVTTLAKQFAEADYQKRVAELEHQVKAISSQPVIHTTVSAQLSGQRVKAELDTGAYPAISIQDFGGD